ncbi:hypothetical protein [Syntrophobacter fumaroxidans]|uniref:Lipoprotein n=1 Tax=Syntrophobacter fumaroxidans (strain DSM 10017 / MPOB) TaxID=335543 RepID=A0LKD1_SYNFM|nr:hypothetical protein [Syntrophobacter fumaroxidans]ABK17883.1 conserved hypothetical protein [Syntrophobacter fumaroxidans MPOB]
MKKKSFVVLFMIAAVFVLVTGAACAESIPDKVAKQQSRIDHGIRSGQLSVAESEILQNNLNHIKNRYYRLVSEGRLTRYERASLNRQLQQNSHMIYNRKHNAVRALY